MNEDRVDSVMFSDVRRWHRLREIVKHYKQRGVLLQMVTVSNWARDRRLLGEQQRYNDGISWLYPLQNELFITANRMMGGGLGRRNQKIYY
jgi:hypothetical protein